MIPMILARARLGGRRHLREDRSHTTRQNMTEAARVLREAALLTADDIARVTGLR